MKVFLKCKDTELAAIGRDIEDVYVVRLHNGVAERLESKSVEHNEATGVYTIWFATNRFSSYLLMFDRVLGDIDNDAENAVNAMDVVRLMKYVVDETVVVVKGSTDINGDGRRDILDVLRLVRYLAGHEVRLY